MSLTKLTDEAVAALVAAVPDHDFSDQQKQQMSRIIEKTLLKTVDHATAAHSRAIATCCGPEADMAHKIDEEVRRANVTLIANLSAMR